MKRIPSNLIAKTAVSLISLLMFFVPFYWLGTTYFVGGDNGQLYYYMPREMLANYVFNGVGDNTLGILSQYGQQTYQAPFFILIATIKNILPASVNTQAFFFGANIAGGFLGMYWLLGLWIKGDTLDKYVIRLIGSLIYCTSSFIFSTNWYNAVYSIYLIAVYPIVLQFVLRGIEKEKIEYLAIAALIASLFSIVLHSVPWLLGSVLMTIPLLVLYQLEYKKTYSYLIYFALLLVGINAYWLTPMFVPLITGGVGFFVPGFSEIDNALMTVREVIVTNNLLYQFLGTATPRWFESHYSVPFVSLLAGGLLTLVIPLAGIFGNRTGKLRRIYLSLTVCWLIAMYLYTVRIGWLGEESFLWLIKTLPGFSMFKNNYDKFSHGIGFIYSLSIAVSLGLVLESIPVKRMGQLRNSILGIGITMTVLAGFIFLYVSPFSVTIGGGTSKNYPTFTRFNDEFVQLTDYLRDEKIKKRVLWIPLNSASYVFIRDGEDNSSMYAGTSPLRFLSGVNDLTGSYSFGDKRIADQLFLDMFDLEEGAFDVLRKMNIGYVVVNNDIDKSLQESYFFSWYKSGDLYDTQMKLMIPRVLGDYIRSFGERYSLYKINPEFVKETIYVEQQQEKAPSVDWTKGAGFSFIQTNSEFAIRIDGLTGVHTLTLLEPLHNDWSFVTKSGHYLELPRLRQFTADELNSNVWVLDTDYLLGTLKREDYSLSPEGLLSVDLKLIWKPAKWTVVGELASVVFLMLVLLYLVIRGVLAGQRKAVEAER
jgi:hypothetical protein